MSRAPILAVYAAPAWRGADALEFLRVVAALVACDHPVRLEQTREGLTGDDLPDEAERILDQLASFGVTPRAPAEEGSGSSRAVLRFEGA